MASERRLPVEGGEGRESFLRAGRSGLSQEGRASRHVARAANALHEHHAVAVLAERVLLLRGLLEPAARRSQVLRYTLAVEVRLAEGSLGPAFATFSSFAEPGPGGGTLGSTNEAAVAARGVGLVVVRERTARVLSSRKIKGAKKNNHIRGIFKQELDQKEGRRGGI